MTGHKGKFISIEGLEGVGKSTQIETLKEFLDRHGIDFIVSREPGGTLLAEKIRELLLAVQEEPVDPVAELLLIFAARAQHLSNRILPALRAGKWVICDRFTDATYAYQGGGRQLGDELIASLENLVQGELRPDFTIILDLDPKIGLQRAQGRGELDRFEREQVEFFDRVRQVYLTLAAREPERYLLVDASPEAAVVRARLLETLSTRLELGDDG